MGKMSNHGCTRKPRTTYSSMQETPILNLLPCTWMTDPRCDLHPHHDSSDQIDHPLWTIIYSLHNLHLIMIFLLLPLTRFPLSVTVKQRKQELKHVPTILMVITIDLRQTVVATRTKHRQATNMDKVLPYQRLAGRGTYRLEIGHIHQVLKWKSRATSLFNTKMAGSYKNSHLHMQIATPNGRPVGALDVMERIYLQLTSIFRSVSDPS